MYRGLNSCFVFGLAIFSAGNESAYAGAWLRDQGQSEIIFSSAWTGAKQRFNPSGNPISIGQFSKLSAQALAEYGLTSDVTLVAGLNGHQQHFSRPGLQQANSNIGGLAGARLKLWSSNQTVFSMQATTEIASEGQSGISRSRRFEPPATADLRLLLGHNFTLNGLPAFVDVQSGYRWRGGSHANEIRIDFTFGAKPMAKTLILIQSFNTIAAERDRRFTKTHMRQHKLQASLVYELTENLSLQAGTFIAVNGQESLRERGGLLALWWKL
jgi:protein XagA